MSTDDVIRAQLRPAEGCALSFRFTDGQALTAKVIDVSHLDLNDTVIIEPLDAAAAQPCWNVHLDEIAALSLVDA